MAGKVLHTSCMPRLYLFKKLKVNCKKPYTSFHHGGTNNELQMNKQESNNSLLLC